jgi:hypothetical protein
MTLGICPKSISASNVDRGRNAGISYAVNLYDRQVMIGKVAGLSPSCQSLQTASVDGEFQAADFLRGMRSTGV